MRNLVFGVLLICLILVGYYVGLLMRPKEVKGGVSVTLVVRQYRDGKLIKEVVEKKDPFTNNFVQLLWSAMKTNNGACTGSYTVVDIGGTSRNLYVCRSDFAAEYPLQGNGAYIWIGNGAAPFSLNDYKLSGTSTLKTTPSIPSESIADPKINYTISASFSLSSAMTVSEVGFSRLLRAPDYSNYEFLLMHDVLSTPISAAAGDTITVTYIVRING